MRGRSYSPSPPRGYGRRGRSPSPRGRHGSRNKDKDLPTSLLVRNLRHECRAEDLRRPFGQFGPLKDIYLPRDYYSGEPRGFGFIQYVDPADAQEAKYQMDGQILLGRQLTVVFAEENRKKPTDMRLRERRGGRFSDRRRSPPRYYRSRSPAPRYARSRSPDPRYARLRSPDPRDARSRLPAPRYASSQSNGRDYSPPPKRRQHSRSVSPQEKRYSGERSYSRSPVSAHSPPYNRPKSRSPVRSTSQSPPRGRSPVRGGSPGRSRNRSPSPEH